MRQGRWTTGLVALAACLMLAPPATPQTVGSAVRSVSPTSATPGDTITVTVTPDSSGILFYAVMEDIDCLVYTGKHTADDNPITKPDSLTFIRIGGAPFSYKVVVPPSGTYAITGLFWNDPDDKVPIKPNPTVDVELFGEKQDLPEVCRLGDNRPNPFNLLTRISYQLPERTSVSLKIYNLSGQLVKTLVEGQKPSGWHSVQWDGRDDSGKAVASGIYFYRLETIEFAQAKRALILR